MKKEIIKSLLRDFHTRTLPELTPREVIVPLDSGQIVSLIGARRSGKTFLLYQVAADLCRRGIPIERVLFLNFEDERLDLQTGELDLVLQAYRELYPDLDPADSYFLFDEIQNIAGWERFVRRLHEHTSRNIVITGSNARLLSTEIATALRGRAISRTVLPFSFAEVLRHRRIPIELNASRGRSGVEAALDEYLQQGGFPEPLSIRDPVLRDEILQSYFEVMLLRDLADRHGFTNITALRYFLKRLAASATKPVSIHRIYNELKSAGIRIGKNALYDFLRGAEDIFLVRTLPRFSAKASTRELGEKKLYFIDNGLLNAIRFRFSDDRGKALEQLVFWHLMRSRDSATELFYDRNGHECDFVLQGRERVSAWQVCYSLEDPQTRWCEIKGLLRTCRSLQLSEGIIVTRAERDELEVDGIRIRIRPLAEVLLQDTPP